MARLREDPRFKAVQPDAFDTEGTPEAAPVEGDEVDEGLELWFDWAFVDFWKNHYCMSYRPVSLGSGLTSDTIQRSIAVDPDAVRGSSGERPSADLPALANRGADDQHRTMGRQQRSSCRFGKS